MTLEPSDEALAAQARQDDRRAFDDLVRRHKAPLYRFVRRYVGDGDDAYDIVQDAFISAWGALKRYDPGRPFAPLAQDHRPEQVPRLRAQAGGPPPPASGEGGRTGAA